jgi:hypothetical protein
MKKMSDAEIKGLSDAELEHQLEYNMHSAKVTWCPICHKHFYDMPDGKHTVESLPAKNETNNAEVVGRASFNLSEKLSILHTSIASTNFRNLNAETVEGWAQKVNELTEQARELEREIGKTSEKCGCGKPMRYYVGDKPSCNKHLACLTYDEIGAVLIKRYKQLAELENRIASFQRAQSFIIGELRKLGNDELVSNINKLIHEPLPGNRRIKHGGR